MTLTSVPTETPLSPPATAIPTLPPEPSLPALRTTGPYLAYLRIEENGNVLVFLDADGKGQKVVSLPAKASSPIDPSMLSPDGKWLPYYTGSAGTCMGQVDATDTDLTLNLMEIDSGQSRIVSRLLSADYPNIFDKAFQELSPESKASIVTAQNLKNAFVCGIHASAWSPDGRTLAFAGEMDGLSSDLYIYDLKFGAVRRLSSGPEEIRWIGWSPDGEWILDGSNLSFGEGETYDVFASKVDGSTVRQLATGTQFSSPIWIGPETFFQYEDSMGVGPHKLQLVDLAKDTRTMVWTGGFMPLAISDTKNWIAFFAQPTNDNQTGGPYLIDLNTMKILPVKTPDNLDVYGMEGLQYLGLAQDKMFLLEDDSDGILYYVSTTGVLTSTGVTAGGGGYFTLSPNKKILLILLGGKIGLYSPNGELIRYVNLPANLSNILIYNIIWRPDSSGIFINKVDYQSAIGSLYSLDLSSGEVVLVDGRVSTDFGNDPVWVSTK